MSTTPEENSKREFINLPTASMDLIAWNGTVAVFSLMSGPDIERPCDLNVNLSSLWMVRFNDPPTGKLRASTTVNSKSLGTHVAVGSKTLKGRVETSRVAAVDPSPKSGIWNVSASLCRKATSVTKETSIVIATPALAGRKDILALEINEST